MQNACQNTLNADRELYGSAEEWGVLEKAVQYAKDHFDDLELGTEFFTLNLVSDDVEGDAAWLVPLKQLNTKIQAVRANKNTFFSHADYFLLKSTVDNVYDHMLYQRDYEDISELTKPERATLASIHQSLHNAAHVSADFVTPPGQG